MAQNPNPAAAGHLPAFQACVDLLQDFLQRRDDIVARIDAVLNCQKKPLDHQQDTALQSRLFKDCFVAGTAAARAQQALCEQLELARCDMGFRPRAQPGNDIIDPVQMLLRGLHFWRQTRWPGQKGRLRYAHTLYNLYLLRCLTLCLLRVWDPQEQGVPQRLQQLQDLLDALWRGSPADQPRLLRSVCWLLPVALSPTTDELAGYFEVARKVADTFPAAGRSETQRAWVHTGAGHLCAQLRHLCVQRGIGLDDHELLLLTRRSNALDVALLVEGLVVLFEAYEESRQAGDASRRQLLAAAICHGFAPDPDLFVNRVDLLGPYSMIETLFVAVDAAGNTGYTPAGRRHLALLQRYATLLARLAPPLLDDLQRSRAQAPAYWPHGALYGFSSNLLELIAFKTLQVDSELRFGMEDVFTPGDRDKRDWVNAWRKLPHVKPEVVQQYEYPQAFVDALLQRVEQALQRRSAASAPLPPACCLQVLPQGRQWPAPALQQLPALPLQHVLSSDPLELAQGRATAMDAGDLLHCRMEGEFLASWPTDTGWMALSKDLLTDVVGEGRVVRLEQVPPAACELLRLMCAGLVLVVE